jgi:hypothetical protein
LANLAYLPYKIANPAVNTMRFIHAVWIVSAERFLDCTDLKVVFESKSLDTNLHIASVSFFHLEDYLFVKKARAFTLLIWNFE